MSGFTEGFKEFINIIDDVKKTSGWAIDYALEETANQCIEDTQKVIYETNTIDTGTLYDSWKIREDNKQTGYSENSVHSVTCWSDPSVIATNPKHPDGEYYPPLIEDGFIKPNGKYYRGKHMLKKAFSNCPRNLKANLKKQFKGVFE